MLEYEEARDRLLADLAPGLVEDVAVADFPGLRTLRFLSADLCSPSDLPAADNSSMDGYALRAEDVTSVPKTLEIVGRQAAGTVTDVRVGKDQAVRIFTGAILPDGANSVVMQEETQVDTSFPGRVTVLDGVKPWENVRFAGEDVKGGSKILGQGEPLTPGRLALIAACGIRRVPCHVSPRVALLATGSELVRGGGSLNPGQVHESNLVPMEMLVQKAGGLPVSAEVVPDDRGLTREALESAASAADLVLSIGGASVGEHDLVRSVAQEAGFQIDFWQVSLKPGKPFFRGRRGNVHLLGVPGNPAAAFVTAVLLVQPALRRLAGAADPMPPLLDGILSASLSNPEGRRHFMRVVLGGDGTIRSAGTQASHLLRSLAAANGLVDVPARSTLEAGARVRVIHW